MVAAMDAVGVDGAVLVSPFTMYRYDASYALEVHRQHPGRFGLVKPVDPSDPAVAETIADWAAIPGTVGIRLMMNRGVSTDPADPGIHRVLAAAARHGLPVNLMCTGRLEQAAQMAQRHPDTQLVIDHLGLPQPQEPPAPAEPFADLPKLLALAAYANVAVKISGACTLSHEPFPYNGHLGSARAHLRRLWPRPLSVGDRLDPRGQGVDLSSRGSRHFASPTACPTATGPRSWARLYSRSITGRRREPDRSLLVEFEILALQRTGAPP